MENQETHGQGQQHTCFSGSSKEEDPLDLPLQLGGLHYGPRSVIQCVCEFGDFLLELRLELFKVVLNCGSE